MQIKELPIAGNGRQLNSVEGIPAVGGRLVIMACGFLPVQRIWGSRKKHCIHRAAAWLLDFSSAQNDYYTLNLAYMHALGNQLSHRSNSMKIEMVRQLNIGERS